MTGTVHHRGGNRWGIVLDVGKVTDPETGKQKRKQRWVAFRATTTGKTNKAKKEAKAKMVELLNASATGTYVEPSKVTLGAWLTSWLDKSIKPLRRLSTYKTYASLVATHVTPSPLASIPLQRLRGSDIEHFYAGLPLAPSSVAVVNALFHKSLQKAVKDKLLTTNPAVNLERKSVTPGQAARVHCWSAAEARQVLKAANGASPQVAAFTYLALDSGARKSELDGLGWSHLDLDAAVVTIERQLDSAGVTPVFGPTKTKKTRTVGLTDETVAKLRAHKKAQAALKMKNRTTYTDHGLVFAKEDVDLQTPEAALGQPLTTLARRVKELVKAADVRPIKFHGLRHTVATLSLQSGTPPHVVAARLGHSVLELMKTYAHALPDQQQDAAARLGRLLHG